MPSPIRVECPHCFSTFKLKSASAIGKKVPCPKCSDPFVVKEMASAVVDDIYQGAEMDDDPYGAPPQVAQQLPGPPRRKLKKKKAPRSASYDDTVEFRTYETTSDAVGSIRAGSVRAPKRDLGIFFWILGGSIAAAIGTVGWVAAVIMTGREFGIIAWALGGLVGLGVRIPARGSEAAGPGLVAAILAIGSIFAAKLIIACLVALVEPAETVMSVMLQLFGLLDLLWVGLAGVTAYKVGASVEDD